MVEINGVHLLIAVVALFVFIVARAALMDGNRCAIAWATIASILNSLGFPDL